MSARAMTMDAAMDSGSLSAPADAGRTRPFSAVESPWVLAAVAAAPWPAWVAVAAVGVPGGPLDVRWLHGVGALALIFAAMVGWTHRPSTRRLARFVPAVLGTGLMGELLANALTDLGRGVGLAGLEDGPRALTTALACVAVYEVGPIVAATARLSRDEPRHRVLDAVAYALFLGLAAGAWAWEPVARARAAESLWTLSPWMAVALAAPLAAARSAHREARLPTPRGRGGALGALAALGWLLVGALGVAGAERLATGVHDLRWGATPFEGLRLWLPALSIVLSLAAAASLLVRAFAARRAPGGLVTGRGDDGLTLESEGTEAPVWVAVDDGELPEEGVAITLLGASTDPAAVGPFRDGATRWRARRVWRGAPAALSRTLRHRAAGWAIWAALSAGGLLWLLG
ncbi:MAG TPA: hypothetical protein RMH99_13000 [Sandaracinaceae bacterium LLY-WYZ-13_1]|nr:hypothetical protein [Sandaracinaceae bacterium LLY-WYZ-13_1]